MEYSNFLFSVLIVLFTACNNRNQIIYLNDQFTNSKFVIEMNPKGFKSHRLKFDRKTEHYYYLTDRENKLSIIDSSGIVIDSIFFNKSYNIQDYYVINLDSIYICNDQNQLSLFGKDGKEKFHWNFSEPIGLDSFYITENSKLYPLIILNNYVYVYHSVKDETSEENMHNYFSNSKEVIFYLDSIPRLINKSGRFPKNYIGKSYYDFVPMRELNKNNELIYSFEASDSIFIYDQFGRKLRDNAITSNLFANNTEFKAQFENNDKYVYLLDKYMMSNTRYRKLYSDSYRNQYYRILRPKCKFENEDGTINYENSCDWYLIVLDVNFKTKKIIKFPGNIYNFSGPIVTNKGFMIPLQARVSNIRYEIYNF